MTVKETLRSHYHGWTDEQFNEEINRFPLVEVPYAMDEYAKQQLKEFAEWIDENNCVFNNSRNLWIDKTGKIFTTDQLINEFLKQK